MKTKVVIPHLDTDGNKSATILSFHGAVDRRRLKREVRKFVRSAFGRSVTVEWIAKVPQYYQDVGRVVTNEEVEDWIQRIQDDSSENEGDCQCQAVAS